MASLAGMQDPTGGQVAQDRGALPAGKYVAALVKSEGKATKDGSGSYIECEFQVMDGPHKDRRFWHMLNLENRNPQAVEIAWRDLNSMKHACGRLSITDTSELHGIPMTVGVGIKTDSYGQKNKVTSFAPLNSQPTANAAPPPAQQAASGAAAWRR